MEPRSSTELGEDQTDLCCAGNRRPSKAGSALRPLLIGLGKLPRVRCLNQPPRKWIFFPLSQNWPITLCPMTEFMTVRVWLRGCFPRISTTKFKMRFTFTEATYSTLFDSVPIKCICGRGLDQRKNYPRCAHTLALVHLQLIRSTSCIYNRA